MLRLLFSFVLVASFAACNDDAPRAVSTRAAPTPTPVVAAVAPGPAYSPFVIHMEHEELPFGHISFKDVGMSLPETERVLAYETLAESLSMELQRGVADLSTEVRHTVEILDPAAHLACEGEHIYVDLWRAGSGWGYSLWSGCGENDEFAHREIASAELAPREGGLAASFDPLTRDIAASLLAAVESGCFTRHC